MACLDLPVHLILHATHSCPRKVSRYYMIQRSCSRGSGMNWFSRSRASGKRALFAFRRAARSACSRASATAIAEPRSTGMKRSGGTPDASPASNIAKTMLRGSAARGLLASPPAASSAAAAPSPSPAASASTAGISNTSRNLTSVSGTTESSVSDSSSESSVSRSLDSGPRIVRGSGTTTSLHGRRSGCQRELSVSSLKSVRAAPSPVGSRSQESLQTSGRARRWYSTSVSMYSGGRWYTFGGALHLKGSGSAASAVGGSPSTSSDVNAGTGAGGRAGLGASSRGGSGASGKAVASPVGSTAPDSYVAPVRIGREVSGSASISPALVSGTGR
mmetsp:Transcript_22252/g.67621  ORF Transcript_22252/g.67621 Transcript_22252/m.67621 type:complete len:332 (+) Transcript_22252:106-1101(+)|eukprot:scaffold53427_cov25-Tisochrysis_lutea.AAC.5